ncbi:hypothetical protein C8Q77DRAFT_1068594, partial [Trametes polyzona]
SVRGSLSNDQKSFVITVPGIGFDIYSVKTGMRVRRFPSRSFKRALPAVFAENDRYLVCGSEVGEVPIWDIFTGNTVQTLAYHSMPIQPSSLFRVSAPQGQHIIATGIYDELQPCAALWTTKRPVTSSATTVSPVNSTCESLPHRENGSSDRLDLPSSGLTPEMAEVKRALVRRSNQLAAITVVANQWALDADYYRRCCKELEEVLVERLASDPDTLRALFPLRFSESRWTGKHIIYAADL